MADRFEQGMGVRYPDADVPTRRTVVRHWLVADERDGRYGLLPVRPVVGSMEAYRAAAEENDACYDDVLLDNSPGVFTEIRGAAEEGLESGLVPMTGRCYAMVDRKYMAWTGISARRLSDQAYEAGKWIFWFDSPGMFDMDDPEMVESLVSLADGVLQDPLEDGDRPVCALAWEGEARGQFTCYACGMSDLESSVRSALEDALRADG